jgi:hypothetical protein
LFPLEVSPDHNTLHACGSVTDTMKVVKLEKKKAPNHAWEIPYMCKKMSKNGLHRKDAHTDAYNLIFQALTQIIQERTNPA